jgi:hypothetical protein
MQFTVLGVESPPVGTKTMDLPGVRDLANQGGEKLRYVELIQDGLKENAPRTLKRQLVLT